ncbi:hypothetical protein GCM10010885_10350 [Alicyclobacillus cellulosilyticus]|uniref:Copper amine oxidase-like protein n=1 Tax=Alicyclobacillus cellulosilyticus TaxID=1003997 RepID=A0A917K6M7_9BACL|nr:LppP/LprE family lipoprotein [Alicyclobacillus cellulosilyticus]GGJ02995.1 hypothetical protein GCM10010885_10350 [Alicyclobacillus cellulosilyticus]
MKKSLSSSVTAVSLVWMGLVFPCTASAAVRQVPQVAQATPQVAQIVVNGHVWSDNVPFVVRNGTDWLPLDVLMQALTASGLQAEYDGRSLLIKNLANLALESLSTPQANTIHMAMDAYVLTNVPVLTWTSNSGKQTYVPVPSVIQVLTHSESGYFVTWKDHRLTLTNDMTGAPSLSEIERVMSQTTEIGDPTEHFMLIGKPVSITIGNGDTVTAAVGMRWPTADGYGQVVFFFHNHQFVGLDSDVEKTEIQSLRATQSGMAFEVTYADYAPDDPMYNPSLPPVTVTFGWDGSTFVPSGRESIPRGALNQLKVRVHRDIQPISYSGVPDEVRTAIRQALPKGGALVNRPGSSSPYLAVDLNADGQDEYVVAYRNGFTMGLLVMGESNGKWKVLWNKALAGTQLSELNAGPMTGDGTEEIAFQSYLGDGANNVLILKWVNGVVKPVLQVTGVADIGDFNQDGVMEVANWVHDTGPLEKIQLYAWDAAKGMYERANNDDFPRYFGGAPLAYDQWVRNSGEKNQVPPKMLDYALASTYEEMGLYNQAVMYAKLGLQQPARAYPENRAFQSILNQAMARQKQAAAYVHLPASVRRTVDRVLLKYSNFYNPPFASTPMVAMNKDGSWRVRVIGGMFHNLVDGRYVLASELAFTVSRDGSSATSLVARNALGQRVWLVNAVQ